MLTKKSNKIRPATPLPSSRKNAISPKPILKKTKTAPTVSFQKKPACCIIS